MKTIFVAGSWGSGTSMVTGALDRLGVSTFGPHFQSNDPKTPNTFELMPFREIILNHVDEAAMLPRERFSNLEEFSRQLSSALRRFGEQLERGEFGSWPQNMPKVVALKMPLASMCLPEIVQALSADIILVHRPLREIEASRLRRNWLAYMGSAGANRIYLKILADLMEHRLSALMVSHGDFVTNTRDWLRRIIHYCGLHFIENNIENAVNFIRRE